MEPLKSAIYSTVEYSPGKKIVFALYFPQEEKIDNGAAESALLKSSTGADIVFLICVAESGRFWASTLGLINSTIDVHRLPELVSKSCPGEDFPMDAHEYLLLANRAFQTAWPSKNFK